MATLVTQDIHFAETALVRAEGTATVAATPAEIWAVLVDCERWPRWFFGVRSCEATSDPAGGVGSTRRVQLTGGARFEERFIAWEPGALWAFTAESMAPPVFRSLVERVTITEVAPGRTSVTYRVAFDPVGWLRPTAPILRAGLRRTLTRAMGRLGDEAVDRR